MGVFFILDLLTIQVLNILHQYKYYQLLHHILKFSNFERQIFILHTISIIFLGDLSIFLPEDIELRVQVSYLIFLLFDHILISLSSCLGFFEIFFTFKQFGSFKTKCIHLLLCILDLFLVLSDSFLLLFLYFDELVIGGLQHDNHLGFISNYGLKQVLVIWNWG